MLLFQSQLTPTTVLVSHSASSLSQKVQVLVNNLTCSCPSEGEGISFAPHQQLDHLFPSLSTS